MLRFCSTYFFNIVLNNQDKIMLILGGSVAVALRKFVRILLYLVYFAVFNNHMVSLSARSIILMLFRYFKTNMIRFD